MITIQLPNGKNVNIDTNNIDEATQAAQKIVNSSPYLEEEIARQRESGSVDYSLQKKLETKIQEDFTDKTGIPLIPNPLELAGLDGVFTKASRDIFTGLATLPYDIASYFNPKYEETSKKIENILPKVTGLSKPEEIAATGLQYAVGGIAGASKGLEIAKNAPKAVKYAAAVTGAALGDVAVTPPSDAVTIGDVVGGPTSINQNDPDILKRLKVGAEGLVVAPIIDTAIKAGATAIKGTKSLFKPFTESGQKEIAGKYIAQQAGIYDPKKDTLDLIQKDKILKAIDDGVKLEKDIPGFKLTLGTSTQNLNLIALERGLAVGATDAVAAGNVPPKSLYVRRSIDNMSAISAKVDDLLDARGTNMDGYSRFFKNEVDKLEFVRAKSKLRVLEAESELANIVDDFLDVYPTTAGVRASVTLDEQIAQTLKAVTERKNQLFDSIDPANQLLIDHLPLKRVVKDITTPKNKLDFTPNDLPSDLISRIKKSFIKDKKTNQVNLTFGAIQSLRPKLSEAISNARAANQGGVVESLNKLKGVADGYINKVADLTNAPASAQAALDYYKNTYIPTFRESIGNQFRKNIRKGVPFNPSETAGKFLLNRPGGQIEAATNLSKIISVSETPATALASIKNYLGSELSRLVVGTKGTAVPKKIDRFKQNYAQVLDLFPQIKNDIDNFQKNLFTKTGALNEVEQAFRINKEKFNKNSIAYKLGQAELYLNKNPVQAIQEVLRSKDSSKELSKLLKLVNQDTSGEALKGLKNAFKETVWQGVTTNKQLPEGELYEVSRNIVAKLFKENNDVLKKLFTPDEYQNLQQVQNALNNLDLLNYAVTTGSPTASLTKDADKFRIVLASWYGIVKGRGISQIIKFASNLLGINPQGNINKLLTDSMLDPSLAKEVIRVVTPQTERPIEEAINTYITNNILTSLAEPEQN